MTRAHIVAVRKSVIFPNWVSCLKQSRRVDAVQFPFSGAIGFPYDETLDPFSQSPESGKLGFDACFCMRCSTALAIVHSEVARIIRQRLNAMLIKYCYWIVYSLFLSSLVTLPNSCQLVKFVVSIFILIYPPGNSE